MGASKLKNFNRHQNKISRIARALGHPARVAIIDHLIENKTSICEELVQICQLSQPTVSRHLKVLICAGIISADFIENTQYFSVRLNAVEELVRYLDYSVYRTVSSMNRAARA